MKKSKALISLCAGLIIFTGGLNACSHVIIRTVKESETSELPAKIDKGKALNTVSSVLLNQGFDLKMTNKEIGLITTEWKKYTDYHQGEKDIPFFLQIRSRITEKEGKLKIRFIPVVKVGDDESELIYMDKNPGFKSDNWDSINKGTILYNNVLREVSDTLGIPFDYITHTFSQTEQ